MADKKIENYEVFKKSGLGNDGFTISKSKVSSYYL